MVPMSAVGSGLAGDAMAMGPAQQQQQQQAFGGLGNLGLTNGPGLMIPINGSEQSVQTNPAALQQQQQHSMQLAALRQQQQQFLQQQQQQGQAVAAPLELGGIPVLALKAEPGDSGTEGPAPSLDALLGAPGEQALRITGTV